MSEKTLSCQNLLFSCIKLYRKITLWAEITYLLFSFCPVFLTEVICFYKALQCALVLEREIHLKTKKQIKDKCTHTHTPKKEITLLRNVTLQSIRNYLQLQLQTHWVSYPRSTGDCSVLGKVSLGRNISTVLPVPLAFSR